MRICHDDRSPWELTTHRVHGLEWTPYSDSEDDLTQVTPPLFLASDELRLSPGRSAERRPPPPPLPLFDEDAPTVQLTTLVTRPRAAADRRGLARAAAGERSLREQVASFAPPGSALFRWFHGLGRGLCR